MAPPAGWKITEEKKAYSEDEKRQYLAELRRVRTERGYAIEWIYKRFHAKFGESVAPTWMLPPVKRQEPVIDFDVDDGGPDDIVEPYPKSWDEVG